jgi:hypothetical protein
VIAVFQDSSVALSRQFDLHCQLSLFVNYLALLSSFILYSTMFSYVWTSFALLSCVWQQDIKEIKSKTTGKYNLILSQFIFGFSGGAMTQIQNSLFVMRHYDVIIVFVESQWYNDTSPEYCFSLRAATRQGLYNLSFYKQRYQTHSKRFPQFASKRNGEERFLWWLWRGEIQRQSRH